MPTSVSGHQALLSHDRQAGRTLTSAWMLTCCCCAWQPYGFLAADQGLHSSLLQQELVCPAAEPLTISTDPTVSSAAASQLRSASDDDVDVAATTIMQPNSCFNTALREALRCSRGVLLSYRAVQELPECKPVRVAVKRFHSASQADVLQEERMVIQMSDKPATVKYHGLFWDPEAPSSSSSRPAANLIMG